MSSRARRWPVTVALSASLALAAGGTLSACGGGTKLNGEQKKTGSEVAQDAINALRGTSSVRMAGKATSNNAPVTLDLTFKGNDTKGSLSTNGTSFQIVKIGDKAYIKGDKATYTSIAGAAAAQLIGDRWLLMSGDKASGLTDITLGSFTSSFSSTSKWSKTVEQTKLDGEKVVVVTDTSDGSKLYVANTGKPYPLNAEKAGSDGGSLTFSDYDKDVTISAPADAIDVNQLESGGSNSSSSPSPTANG
jgi:hypothetical protein